jgi:hypothetical protein
MVEEENKDLDEIANAVCPKVEYGREKIIRIIKDFIGEEYLIQHSQSLKYDIQKAQLARKRKRVPHKKFYAIRDSKSDESTKFNVLVDALKMILEEYTLADLKKALAKIEMEVSSDESPVLIRL